MDRSIIAAIMLLIPTLGHAQYFIYSNQFGRLQVSTSLEDASQAAGSVVTSSVMPYFEPDPVPPTEFPSGIISGGRIVAQGVDIEATSPDTGYILVDTSTNKWLVTIADKEVIAVQISASPEITMEQRRILLDAERANRRALRNQLKAVRTNLAAIAYNDFAAAQRDEMRMIVNQMQELRKVLRDVIKGSD
jgi:hypothetical protein